MGDMTIAVGVFLLYATFTVSALHVDDVYRARSNARQPFEKLRQHENTS